MEPTFQWGWRIKYIACYMVVSAQKKNSEHEGVWGWGRWQGRLHRRGDI